METVAGDACVKKKRKIKSVFFAQHENRLALLNNSVPSCQELRAAEVKLSARQERKKEGRF